MLEDLKGYQLLEIWGVAVMSVWLGSQALATTGILEAQTTLGIITLWLIGVLITITASAIWTTNNSFEWILAIWPAAGVTGILLNYALTLGYISLDPTLVYGVFWFAAVGVGFLATVYYVEGWSRKLYGAAAALNFTAALAILQVPEILPYYFTIAAVIQGAPMLINGLKE